MDYKNAVELLENGDGKKVRDYFKENGFLLEYGYTFLLNGELEKAKEILNKLPSTRAEWAINMMTFLQDGRKKYPTFFQIRNFLEIDISLFFKYNQLSFIQKLIDNSDTFQDINMESYKFFARALLKHNYIQPAKMFLDKSLDDYYNDVELHYLYAEFFMVHHDKENILKAVDTCLRLNPTYYPALKTQKELTLKAD